MLPTTGQENDKMQSCFPTPLFQANKAKGAAYPKRLL